MATKRKVLNKLTMVQSAKLVDLIDHEFVSSGMFDIAFAEHASKVLGFPVIDRHVKSRREAMDIKTPERKKQERIVARPMDITAMQELVSGLEKRIELLEKAMLLKYSQSQSPFTVTN